MVLVENTPCEKVCVMKLLLAEDNPAIRQMLRECLAEFAKQTHAPRNAAK